jgi:type III restriction enzyme
MKFEPKDFQDEAVVDLLKRLTLAKQGIAAGIPQAIVLSSPTGSGKTVTLAALLEHIVRGDSEHEENPNATFLWVSDSPELNVQSLDKIFRASDAFPLARLVPVDASFDQERFTPGHVYFINTSKLGKEKLLTTQGDKRTWTFWQTVSNTAASGPEDFIVVIDEAHRGMGHQSAQERNKARTIVQKFIFGSEADNFPAPGVPIILGMSATPQRFDELLAGTERSKNVVKITIEDVRDSGLLKDLILVQTPSDDTPGDLTLLQQAAQRWHDFGQQWDKYCRGQNMSDIVRPVLVVQVEDGYPERKVLTKTNLGEVIQTIERVVGPLSDDEYAHCFQENNPVEVGGRKIRKIEQSRIQEESEVRVVLFKMSLTTGWDCPRAEVMMSFRKAQDHTLISQLIGRMIRTPLSRRIEGSDVLNTVELFLPHYKGETLEEILKELQNPDAESGLGTHAVSGREVIIYPRDAAMEEAFELIEALPSYSIGRVPEVPPVKRLLRLAARLTLVDELDGEALDEARNACLDVLINARARLLEQDPEFVARVQETGELEITTIGVQFGGAVVKQQGKTKVPLTPENVDDVFDRCGRVLGAGEGLHKEFWKRLYDANDPLRPKLELHEILEDKATLPELKRVALEKFDEIYKRNKKKVAKLTSSAREFYNRLLGAGKEPAEISRTMPPEITVPKRGVAWRGHLYADASGDFVTKLNSWEKKVIDEAMDQRGFVGWLRNFDRKEWAIAIPYDDRGVKPFYPDFIIVRREDGELVADIIDPHDAGRDDTWTKAKGLAEYAEKHGHEFGRLEIAIVSQGSIKRMDMNDPSTRNKAKRFQSNNDVDALFT